MTLKSQIQSDVDTVFLSTSDFAEQIIRYVEGNAGNAQSLTGVVTLEQPDKTDVSGRGYLQSGSVMVADSVTITTQDALQIRGERFEVKTVGIADFGAYEVTVSRKIGDIKGVKMAEGI